MDGYESYHTLALASTLTRLHLYFVTITPSAKDKVAAAAAVVANGYVERKPAERDSIYRRHCFAFCAIMRVLRKERCRETRGNPRAPCLSRKCMSPDVRRSDDIPRRHPFASRGHRSFVSQRCIRDLRSADLRFSSRFGLSVRSDGHKRCLPVSRIGRAELLQSYDVTAVFVFTPKTSGASPIRTAQMISARVIAAA